MPGFKRITIQFVGQAHGLRTPNEGLDQRNPKFWAMWHTKYASAAPIWDWDLIFGRAVKANFITGRP